MIKGPDKKGVRMDGWFLVISALLVITLVSIAIFSIIFLSSHIFQGISALDEGAAKTEFDLEGYRNLNLAN